MKKELKQTFPFRYVYTGIDKTAKRSVDEKVIIRLKGLELNDISGLGFARDLFLFSYCTRGMSFVDMAYLRHKDIRNGYICYKRKKTGRPLSIRIEQIVQEIINRYQKRTTGSCYLFPILHTEDDEQSDKQYQTGLRYYNKQLNKLASLLGENIVLYFLYIPPYLGEYGTQAQYTRSGHQRRDGAYFRKNDFDLFVFYRYFRYRPCRCRTCVFVSLKMNRRSPFLSKKRYLLIGAKILTSNELSNKY